MGRKRGRLSEGGLERGKFEGKGEKESSKGRKGCIHPQVSCRFSLVF